MRKRSILIALGTPFIVLFGLIVFILTPLSAPLFKYAANKVVPGLNIEQLTGTILSDINVTGLSWQNAQWQVDVSQGTVNLGWRCVLDTAICFQTFSISGLAVTQLGAAQTNEEPATPTPLTLPIPIRVQGLRLENFRLTMPAASVELAEFSTQIFAHQKIRLVDSQLHNAVIRLPAASEAQADAVPVSYALSYTAPQLPVVQMPMGVELSGLSVQPLIIYKGSELQKIKRIGLAQLGFEKSQLVAEGLFVNHEKGNIDTDIAVEFFPPYPLMVKARGTVLLPDSNQQSARIDASGSLEALQLNVTATGHYTATLEAQANVLSDTLPLQIKADWPEQPLPTQEGSSLHAGSLELSGKMGGYHLHGQGGATLAEIGPVPAIVDITLNPTDITVNEAKIDVLGGSITNTGTLYLNETASWTGKTQVSGINSTARLKNGPTNINGQFTSLMRMTDSGPEMSLSELSLTAMQSGAPLSVAGAAVYSSANDLMVANLGIHQQDNTLNLVGQLLNQRYLNARLNIDMPQLSTLHPEFSGRIKGSINAQGPWQDPQSTADLQIFDLQATPQFNEFMASQGPINGEVALEGSFSSHQLALSISVPQHQADLTVSGNWQQNRWQGKVQSSNVKLLNTQWALESPFDLTIKPQPIEANIAQHCWASRRDGELCIEGISVAGGQTNWQLQASALPLGLWLHELQPALLPEAPDTTLSFNSTGQVGPKKPPQGQFSMQASATTWKLGKEQNVVISTAPIRSEGVFQQGKVSASAELLSPELGGIRARITADTGQPEIGLNGNLLFDNLNLKPLQPVSKAIRNLTGAFNGDLNISGTVSTPLLNGTLALDNGAIDIQNMPVVLNDWHQEVTFSGQQASFNGNFLLGGGKGTLGGEFSWHSGVIASLALKGKQFEIHQPQLRMQISPDLTASINPGEINVNGSVAIPWARADIIRLPQNAVSPSKDVHLRGEPPVEDPFSIVKANITLDIDKKRTGEVKLDAFGLKSNLHGALKLSTHPALVGYGSLQILDGRYQAYGQDLLIQTGEVQFNGPMDQPFLLVEAVRDPKKTDDDVVAGVRIDGPADSAGVNLFCEPSMDQSACLSYLLNGRGPSGNTGDTNYSALLLGFGLSRTDSLTSQVGNALGIQDLSVGTTSGAGGEAFVSVTGRINDRLSMEYNFDTGIGGTDSTDSVIRRRQQPPDMALRYDLYTRLFLEAAQTTIEEQTEFALDLYYEFFLGEDDANEEPDDTPENEN
ncbi:DUF490 domain-containing protein [Alteromonas aestuariivivens]|uniref:DUF490 domain-containing protein n=1 Tax=Alteromonas aestuariivivens TaxID=1938339 RepID=A0A3D8M5K9_9ALTE|nr:translocation/assembly module TamB domain-containing protein [Alteromonas aestuariivivens]RDV24824.1 DUF490 domain-containing protein [Alteromonas aestuariivivens]